MTAGHGPTYSRYHGDGAVPNDRRPAYSPYHPRWLRPRMSTYWWLGKWPYVKFILRELSSIFVAWFVIFLLIMISMVSAGPAGYERFLAFAAHPVVLAVNVLTLFFIAFHAFTWFALAPRAMVVHLGKKRVPPGFILAANYAGWIAATSAVLWALLR
jgi:fumarate reductase subunit C